MGATWLLPIPANVTFALEIKYVASSIRYSHWTSDKE